MIARVEKVDILGWNKFNLAALKMEHSEPILIVYRTECMKLIDYFGLSIETDLSKVGKMNVHYFRIGSIPSTSSGNPHI